MSVPQRVLLLMGSPRKAESLSESLGNYLIDQMRSLAPQLETETFRLYPALNTNKSDQALFEAVDRADLIVLAFPLYIDNLPVNTIRALERLGEYRERQPAPKAQALMLICNCGFPEAQHCKPAEEICRSFARHVGMAWRGALLIGAGGMYGGAPLGEQKGRNRYLVPAFEQAAAALVKGEEIPAESSVLAATPSIPRGLYTFMGNLGWYTQALKNKVFTKLNARPYLS